MLTKIINSDGPRIESTTPGIKRQSIWVIQFPGDIQNHYSDCVPLL